MSLAFRNLRQAKLRTALTVIGVVIGVGAIITMVSLGLGLQQNILANALSKLDLYTRITVLGISSEELLALNDEQKEIDNSDAGGDSARRASSGTKLRPLNDTAIAEIQRIAGVKYVIPTVNFAGFARFNDRTRQLGIGGAPSNIDDYSPFSEFLAGGKFTNDNAQEAVLTETCLNQFMSDQVSPPGRGGLGSPRVQRRQGLFRTDEQRAQEASQVIGKEIVILTLKPGTSIQTITNPQPPRNSSATGAANTADVFDDTKFDRHAFRIVGVIPSGRGPNLNIALGGIQMMIPLQQAAKFRKDNADLMTQMTQALAGDAGYPSAEIKVADPTQVQPLEDKLKAMGFRAFSVTNLIEGVKLIFYIINGSLAAIGGIALIVASFGISNTMIMSIRERTREIGIMKAIGGSNSEIMKIFFVEASLIGFSGGVFGVMAGWLIDAIANFLVNRLVIQQATSIQFFSIPWYLWGGAIAFAVTVSLLAAIYPAFHAAKVDPIKALRHE
jgi:ABC-type antimicrobial peptide transport system permease subunit